jgi:hypothetical protein
MQRSLLAHILMATLTGASLAGCAATTDKESTSLAVALPHVRLDPPRPGENVVYFDFRDLTGSGLEEDGFDALERAILDRGWQVTRDYHEAYYVLWADVRLFDIAGTKAGDDGLSQLGAIGAGAAAGYGIARVTDNTLAGVVGGGVSYLAAREVFQSANSTAQYQMVIDLVLGRKVEGGVESHRSIERSFTTASYTAVGHGQGGELALGTSRSTMAQELEERRVHHELEQRLIATTQGRRMTKDMARIELLERLVEGLKSQLPRVR